VKRYHFHIQFYTHESPTVPTEVIFTDWIADPILLTDFTCAGVTKGRRTEEHITCSFTTPDIPLADNNHVHFFRLEFGPSGWNGWANNLGYDGS